MKELTFSKCIGKWNSKMADDRGIIMSRFLEAEVIVEV